MSNFVCSACESLYKIIIKFWESPENKGQIPESSLTNFFDTACQKFLHSFGHNLKLKSNFEIHKQTKNKILQECKQTPFMGSKGAYYIDSGGFQVSTGILDAKRSDLLVKYYYEFLEEYPNSYEKAFILDIPPGPGCQYFNSFDDVYRKNLYSYTKAANFPDHIRSKIIYIHHFRTPKLWNIFNRILYENNFFEKFQYFGTGGISANMKTDIIVPFILYSIPLVPILNLCKKYNRKEIKFHILGGSGFRDVLFYKLFSYFIEKEHQIKCEITYDSSTIFKGFMVGRILYIMDNGILKKVNIRTNYLDKKAGNESSLMERIRNDMNIMCKEFNFELIETDTFYGGENNSFTKEMRLYASLYMIYMYYRVEKMLDQIISELYNRYKEGNFNEFQKSLFSITKLLNSGRPTQKQIFKTQSVLNSLSLIQDLDEDKCNYLINHYLHSDEFSYLKSSPVLSF
ncbi:MAG: hypothetical protein KatS3mg002_0346 [Candidatus Woesearchaeota archaeon]|nr:MAG: hypothetical protein KatS3mg002_0346 [Candidatus Woesearchaeota archaeon]